MVFPGCKTTKLPDSVHSIPTNSKNSYPWNSRLNVHEHVRVIIFPPDFASAKRKNKCLLYNSIYLKRAMNINNCFLSPTITDHQRRIQTSFLCLIANKNIAWYIHIDLPTEKANNQINLMRSDPEYQC